MRIINLLKFLAIVLVMTAIGSTDAKGQNLTGAQMNIYFGHPKKVRMSNQQGAIVTEFDRDGRILSVSQGNMRMVYDWSAHRDSVTLSMYQGPNMKDAGLIEISEFTKTAYRYKVAGLEYKVEFKENGAMLRNVTSNAQVSTTSTYLYRAESDMFPYAIEQTMGDQAIRWTVTINQTDSYGNPTEFTQETIGMKNVTRFEIEYY